MMKSWKQYKEEYKDDLVWGYALYMSDGDPQTAAEWLWYKEEVEGTTYQELAYEMYHLEKGLEMYEEESDV